MQNNIENLKKEFKRIKNMGWVEEKRKSKGASGYTFETLLKKEEDDLPIPDYDGIEIKTINKNTKTNLHLFNLTPDGDYLFPIKRLLEELGMRGKDNDGGIFFYRSFNAINDTKIIYGRKGKLIVNYVEKKIELSVVNNQLENINIGVSWSFDYIKERLNLKLTNLAIINVSSCIIVGKGYYHYDSINFYKLRDFDTFIKLIEKGIIEITFKIGVHKSGKKKGKTYDHGTDFSINVKDIELLYEKIDD